MVKQKKKELVRNEVVGYGNHMVTMDNLLPRSIHHLTLGEKRLVVTAISLQSQPTDADGYHSIDVCEYAKTFDIEENTAYEQCMSASKTIRRKWLEFIDKDERDKFVEYGFAWFTAFRYNKNEGSISYKLNPDLKPYISGLKEQFVKYRLEQTQTLKSIHSWRLFELLLQFKNTGLMVIKVAEFRQIMEVDSEYYRKNFARLRTKIIEPAMEEIEQKMQVEIELTTKRKGRRIDLLEFKFQKKAQRELPFPYD